MRFLIKNKVLTPANASLVGIAVFSAGSIALLGWLTNRPELTTFGFGKGAISFGAAICFMLTGTALLLKQQIRTPFSVTLQRFCSVIIILTSVVGVIDLFRVSQNVKLLFHHESFLMNPPKIVGLFIIGIVLWGLTEKKPFRWTIAVRLGTALLAATGITMLVGSAINTDYLYITNTVKAVSQAAAVIFIFIAFAFWCSWSKSHWNQEEDADTASGRIYRTIDILVTIIVATVALVAFSLSQGQTEQTMLNQLSINGSDKRAYFEAELKSHLDKAQLVSSLPGLVEFIREAEGNKKNDKSPHQALVTSAQVMLTHGFTAMTYTNTRGQVLATSGVFTADPEQRLYLWGTQDIELLWDKGYVLHAKLPLNDKTGNAGFLIGEQRLDALTKVHQKAIKEGTTGDMVVCALVNEKQNCFPFRWGKRSGQYNAYLDGKALPLTRAVHGEVTTAITTDFRRERVMAALGPIGKTGLGLAVKRDMVELYAPVRKQFYTILPFLALLIFGSVWAMRALVHPLVKELDTSRLAMKSMALTDGLTKLANRALFMDRLAHTMKRVRRTKNLMAVLYIDLDHFKAINDTHGHLVGDEVLKRTARHLQSCVRTSDTVARLGGDEFTVILENLTTKQDAERIAQKILQNDYPSDEKLAKSVTATIKTSIGIAFYQGDKINEDELLHLADSALYRCKNEGRAGYRVAESIKALI